MTRVGYCLFPRQPRTGLVADGNYNGNITSYAVSVSTDGTNFTQVATGTWADDPTLKSAMFPAQTARYIRLTALAGHNGYASAAEINVLGTPSS